MPTARKAQISLDTTPYYHCVSRCVRRAYLCGEDTVTGQSYDHRRGWIEDKMLALAKVFALKVCAYAVMSNHYHVVLYIDRELALSWTFDEVIHHWHALFKGCVLSQRHLTGESLGQAQLKALSEVVDEWRQRLMSLSWFMRCLNETIARQSNEEDDCQGRFWEGRFKSQALLDDAALAACMAYVDLNPIRAAIATSPETSAHTSIKQRIKKAKTAHTPNHPNQQVASLMPFAGNPRQGMPKGLPFQLTEYIELVDWTGRQVRADKPGAIDDARPPVLARLNIETKHWDYMTQHFESRFKGLVGSVFKLKQACLQRGLQRTPGLAPCQAYFP